MAGTVSEIMDIALMECMIHSEAVLDIILTLCIAPMDIAHSDLAQCIAWVMVQTLVTAMVFQIMLGILHQFIQVV